MNPTRSRKLRFALDHNFPAPVLDAFGILLPRVELVPIQDIDAGWPDLDDWELYAALHRHADDWDGLVTNDADQLALAKEMTVLSQTNLTLIIAEGEGHSPVRAVGVLLCHVNHVCYHSRSDRAQIWRLRVSQKNYDEPRTFLEKIADREKTTVEALVRKNRMTARELGRRTR